MLTPRDATEAPTQRSRSPLSPTEVTELATVRLFLILSVCALLCSLRPGFCIVCDFAHARPIMLQHSTSYGTRPDTVRYSIDAIYSTGMRYSATTTAALHLRRGFCTTKIIVNTLITL